MSRRQEKINRTIRDVISDVIQNQLSDPRIRGLVSVTRVETAADLSTSKIYLSVAGVDEKSQNTSIEGIQHASGFIQNRLAGVLTTRSCPKLLFSRDDSLKKSIEILRLINEITPVSNDPEGDRKEEQQDT